MVGGGGGWLWVPVDMNIIYGTCSKLVGIITLNTTSQFFLTSKPGPWG
jgi:hypothetical protein